MNRHCRGVIFCAESTFIIASLNSVNKSKYWHTSDMMAVPYINKTLKSNTGNLTRRAWNSKRLSVVLHAQHLLIHKTDESWLQWIVHSVVDLWPHSLNLVVLEKIENKSNMEWNYRNCQTRCNLISAEAASGLFITGFTQQNMYANFILQLLYMHYKWCDQMCYLNW